MPYAVALRRRNGKDGRYIFERASPGSIADCLAEIFNPQREIATMDKPTVTLVSLDIDTPVVAPDLGGTQGHIKFAGPAPAGLEITVTSSNPNIISVDFANVEANEGETESFTVFMTAQKIGTAVITATSANSVQTEVNVQKANKEGHDTKGKETLKEGKEHGKDVELKNPDSNAAGNSDGDAQAGHGRAFIRSDERPALRLPQVNPDNRKGADAGHPSQPL
jgi:hypothetical protein